MKKKKSLGHNPLSYSMLGKSNFEFIRSTDPDKSQDEDGKKATKVHKKVVSYYLDEELINMVKQVASEQNASCSGLVGQILKAQLHNNGNHEEEE